MSVETYVYSNPATLDVYQTYPTHRWAEIDGLLDRARSAQVVWARSPLDTRTEALVRLGECIRSKRADLALTITREMGKPITQSLAEIDKCRSLIDFYVREGAGFLHPERVEGAGGTYISYQALGLILAVMPWNFPVWQVLRCAVPNVMLGNGIILKHAPNTPASADLIQELFESAGFPQGLVLNVRATIEDAHRIIGDDRCAGVTFTGSGRAGRAVAISAASALKKSVLELGGSDAYIVLADADLDLASRACAESRLINTGQSCLSAKRFVVVESVINDFLERFTQHFASKNIGNTEHPSTEIGPIARRDLLDHLSRQVERSIAHGARIAFRGDIPEGNGYYYPLTILTDVSPGMPAFSDELFGPVASVVSARDTEEAIAIANRTSYGLGGAIFTKDIAEGERIARMEIQSGSCFVNDFARSDPRIPFGGIKESGYGREMGRHGMLEFANIKTISVLEPAMRENN